MDESLTIQINKKKVIINKNDICVWNKCKGRDNNDKHNGNRENMIYAMINNLIPEEWFSSETWNQLRSKLFIFLQKYHPGEQSSYVCKKLAGRKYNFDFLITNGMDYKNEFKFNGKSVTDLPQILSLSTKFDIGDITLYADYMFDEGFVSKISELYNIPTPQKEEYINFVHQTNYHKHPWCNYIYTHEDDINPSVAVIYMGLNKKKQKHLIADYSIHKYLHSIKDKIDLQKITNKLKQTQLDKHFMLYINGDFNHDKIIEDECTIKHIDSLKKGNHGMCHTIVLQTNKETTKIHMLLRWRNHFGVLNPAWQIKIVRKAEDQKVAANSSKHWIEQQEDATARELSQLSWSAHKAAAAVADARDISCKKNIP